MSVEKIDVEDLQLGHLQMFSEEKSLAKKTDERVKAMSSSFFDNQQVHSLNYFTNSLSETVSFNKAKSHAPLLQDFAHYHQTEIMLCGDKVDGSVSAGGRADSDGNKGVEVEIEVSSKDGNFSAYGGGSVSQDSSGHTKAEVTVGTKWNF